MAANVKTQHCCSNSGNGKATLNLAHSMHWVTLLAAILFVIFPETLKRQNAAIMETLATQTVLIKSLVRQEADSTFLKKDFPIKSLDELKLFDEKINEENRDSYIKAVKSLLRSNVKKNISSVLGAELILQINLDGTHGKIRLKNFAQAYEILKDTTMALKDVSVTIPQAVKRGSNALLICNYDMENDTLYSVKWYKGRREFYRYTPKENPAMKVFIISGLNVERNLSNQSHVVLTSVPLNISGKFTCEISVEAPSFQTAMVSGEMEVVELPEQQATVTGIQPRYRIGDLVDGNCSIKFSKPAANLTWTINGIVVPPHHIKTYQIEKYEDHNLESVVSAINFMATTQHFIKGQMKLKCTASIFNIYKEEIENVIEEDRPRIMGYAIGHSYEMNSNPYDQHSSGDGFEDHNESYLTYHSAADTTSAAMTTRKLPFYIELAKKYHKHWTEFIAINALQPSAAATATAEETFAMSLTLSSIKRNVKRCFSQISARFKTQIENEMASAIEIKAKEENISKKVSNSIDETDDENDGAAAAVNEKDESSSSLLSHNSWHLSECKSAISLIVESSMIAWTRTNCCSGDGRLSSITLLLLLLVMLMHFGRKQRRQQHQLESTECQNKAATGAAAALNATMIVATLKQHPLSVTLKEKNCKVRPWLFNDFLSVDQTYTSQDIEAMKSFYNCQCAAVCLHSISGGTSNVTSTNFKDTAHLQRKQKGGCEMQQYSVVQEQFGRKQRINSHSVALNACQRQMSLSMMLVSLKTSTLMMTTENVGKICYFVKQRILNVAAAVNVAKVTIFSQKAVKLLQDKNEDEKLPKYVTAPTAALPSLDGQVSKLAIMSTKRCENDDC